MDVPTLCLIGAGRAGGSLARHWHAQRAGFKVSAIHTRGGNPLAAALSAIEFSELCDLPDTDTILIATSDQAVASVVDSLAALDSVNWKEKTIFHLSGALGSCILAPLADLGANVASAHPVRAFSHDRTVFEGTRVGVEGSAEALTLLEPAFAAIGGTCFSISSEHKTEYHAAAVIASNHLIALAHASYHLWQQAGLNEETASALFSSLTRGVLDNLQLAKPAQALTGPIARADAATLTAHMQALDQDSARTAKLYQGLSEYLISLDLGHDQFQISALRAALAKK